MKPNAQLPNLRFWIWWNGDWTKITMRPGGSFTIGCGCRTEEGWSAETHSYEYPDWDCCINSEVLEDGRDCDGRMTRVHRWTARSFWRHSKDGRIMPTWVKISARQYDEYAEAAGY